jgi:hypothetical protein
MKIAVTWTLCIFSSLVNVQIKESRSSNTMLFSRKSHWQTLSHNVVSNTPRVGFKLTTIVVIGTNCIGSCKSNYHTITTTTAPSTLGVAQSSIGYTFIIIGWPCGEKGHYANKCTKGHLAFLSSSNHWSKIKKGHFRCNMTNHQLEFNTRCYCILF